MIQAWSVTHQGMIRKENQDSFRLLLSGDTPPVGVVCDGMGGNVGGLEAGQIAAETFLHTLMPLLHENLEAEERSVLIQQAVSRANRAILQRVKAQPELEGMGTTLVAAVFFRDGAAQIANVGDSRAYYITEDGITRITRDHSVVEDMVSRGDITPEQARSHPKKNLITRALGTMQHVKCDQFTVSVREGEYILLCSDGLVSTMADQEILYEVVHGGTPETCCGRLLEIALTRGAPDNVTVILVRV
jgi:protein phosphatase